MSGEAEGKRRRKRKRGGEDGRGRRERGVEEKEKRGEKVKDKEMILIRRGKRRSGRRKGSYSFPLYIDLTFLFRSPL